MRRFLLGLLALTLCGAVVGAVLTWPKPASDPARIGPTLSEFQTGVRISLLADATKQPSRAPAAESEPMQREETQIAAPLAQALGETPRQLDSGWDPSGQTFRVASNQSLQQMLSAGENAPEAGPPRLPLSHAAGDVPRQKDRPTEAVLAASTEPAQGATLAVVSTPEPSPPTVLVEPIAIADTPWQDDRSTERPVVAVETEKPRTRTSNDAEANASHQTLTTGRHVEHIAIHYHGDTRSQTDARRIASRLGSVSLSTVEMHTTAHIIPASLVRYFSRQDAPAAISLAKGLGSKATDWHVDDCTAYQHKPEHGTIQLWPATMAARP
jgi:hypothetical protein